MRQIVFQASRQELAFFLEENETQILNAFREEIQNLDDQIPEERFFVDIKMVPLGEMIIKASLKAIIRFLRTDQESVSSSS